MKRIFIRIVQTFLLLVALVLAVLGIQYFGGQNMGFFSGTTPTNLGFNNGKFVVPSWKPNWVSSTVDKTDAHYIAPLAIGSAPDKEAMATAAFATLQEIVKGSSNVTLKKSAPDYLYAEFKTPGLGFVDDLEIALDRSANVIHVKSGSRLGVRDFSVNRKRVEALREKFSKPMVPKDK